MATKLSPFPDSPNSLEYSQELKFLSLWSGRVAMFTQHVPEGSGLVGESWLLGDKELLGDNAEILKIEIITIDEVLLFATCSNYISCYKI